MDEIILKRITKKSFTLTTLLIWLIFLLLAIPQWMIMCLYSKKPLVYTLASFMIGFILLSCIHMFTVLKYKRPWNFLIVFLCYEVLTIGMGLFLTKWNLINTLILIAVAIVLSAILMLFCWLLIATGAYGNPTKILVLGCLGFIMVYCIRSLDVFNKWFFLRDIEVSVFIASVIVVMVCHVLITNDNFDMLRLDDAVHVALVLHLCYMLLLVAGRISTICIEANVRYFEKKNNTTSSQMKLLHLK